VARGRHLLCRRGIFCPATLSGSRAQENMPPGGDDLSGQSAMHLLAAPARSRAPEVLGETNSKSIRGLFVFYRVHRMLPRCCGPAGQNQRRQKETSVAVLPFNNMSNVRNKVYFNDGITEGHNTDLSKMSDAGHRHATAFAGN